MATDGRGFAGKLADPEVRRERARKAAKARNSPDAHINALVESAPALSSEQVERLRVLLPPSQDGGTDAVA